MPLSKIKFIVVHNIIIIILTGVSTLPEGYRENSCYYFHISLPWAPLGCGGSTGRSPSALLRLDSQSQPGDPQSRHPPPPSMSSFNKSAQSRLEETKVTLTFICFKD